MTAFTRRAWLTATALMATAACGPDPTPAALHLADGASRSALSAEPNYLIVPTTSVTRDQPGVCFDVRNGSREPGAIVQLWDCDGRPGQVFSRDGNNLRIFDDLCLAVALGREVPGGGVQLEPCDLDNLNQGWLFDDDHLKLEGKELCLEVVNGILTRGAGVHLQPCGADPDGQHFAFTDADEKTGPGSPGSRRRAPSDDVTSSQSDAEGKKSKANAEAARKS